MRKRRSSNDGLAGRTRAARVRVTPWAVSACLVAAAWLVSAGAGASPPDQAPAAANAPARPTATASDTPPVTDEAPVYSGLIGLEWWAVGGKYIPGIVLGAGTRRVTGHLAIGALFDTAKVEGYDTSLLGPYFTLHLWYHPFRRPWIDTRVGVGGSILWLSSIHSSMVYGGPTISAAATLLPVEWLGPFVHLDLYPWRSQGFVLEGAPIVVRVGIELRVEGNQ